MQIWKDIYYITAQLVYITLYSLFIIVQLSTTYIILF